MVKREEEDLYARGQAGLVSGANVPDYLARLYEDEDARLRFGRAWLGDDRRVRVRTVIEWEEEKVG